MLIQNYEHIAPFVSNIQASYAWLYKSLDVMVRMHKILSIGSLTKGRPKNQVHIEIMENLRQMDTMEDLELTVHNMHK